ncbi:NYN domain-containing protein, partial [Candidatus Micrarchaeota archaeon]|nr:NYN domain-containing protein [Candidatus Micrarchaeota archaeon]
MKMFSIKTLRKKVNKRKKIAFFVDGPNMLRKEFDVDLSRIKRQLEEHGNVAVAKIFLNQFAPDKLIEAVINMGFEPII